jgi:hypothetical protein
MLLRHNRKSRVTPHGDLTNRPEQNLRRPARDLMGRLAQQQSALICSICRNNIQT